MATEVRRIRLEPHEFQAIVAMYLRDGRTGLPSGFVVDMKTICDAPLMMAVNVQQADGKQEEIQLDEHHIVSSFISFCLDRRIPVAKTAEKTVKITDEDVVFDMVLRLDV